ncbi:hypothetical protein ACFQ1E_05485 [Sphingomonas canadensis]|uniref:J domain-containing protein n=1 Tax=Sphingomonas canadensis TaxID=1219257 RepID=A0ABW3H386_9SPHN|nr:hypothetical protein [Sphingomonas canadensis]MCW3835759.1 hypothetical protein [Sphingomonas canadensis]
MNGADAWHELGIEPTNDPRAIRAAYSAKLKAIDVDREPEAFIALREAFEFVQSFVKSINSTPGSTREAAPDPPEEPSREAEEPFRSDWPAQPPIGTQAHYHALEALLTDWAGQDPCLSDGEKSEALAHWTAIAADPHLQQISALDELERWAAWLISATLPRSNALVMPVVSFFRWERAMGSISSDPGVEYILRHYKALQFLDQARLPTHSHHPAWVELRSKAYPKSNRGRVDPHTVYNILTTVRFCCPEVERQFDPLRVEMWKNNTADPAYLRTVQHDYGPEPGGLPRWVSWLIPAWFLLAIIAASFGHRP